MPEEKDELQPLYNGIEACKNNIKIFEEAIEKERAQIKEYYRMIEVVERKQREAKRKSNIEVEYE